MNEYELITAYGICRVKAETTKKAKYQAYKLWDEAYRQHGLKNKFMEFISSIESIAAIPKLPECKEAQP